MCRKKELKLTTIALKVVTKYFINGKSCNAQPWNQKVLGSTPDSTEDPPCIWASAHTVSNISVFVDFGYRRFRFSSILSVKTLFQFSSVCLRSLNRAYVTTLLILRKEKTALFH
ncbi:hypothetical protein AVEN_41733-1 [Araneus ventricosus]|uniref:Uncharacterized protein n=1 Tax=Araneus ventricosus TaxID=182803 RepID=A0A4Y2AE92_ARAVE|nr:hypothetical protein AVEN_41733-1 [Araneus ventricosus]